MSKKRPKPLYCSFCGKSQHEVTSLIAGPAVLICDECIELCTEVAARHSSFSLKALAESVCRAGIPLPGEAETTFPAMMQEIISARVAEVRPPGFVKDVPPKPMQNAF